MSDTAPPPDPAFRLKSAARIRAGWLRQDLNFLTRSLRYLLAPHGVALRKAAGLEAGEIGILAVVGLNPGISQNDLAASVVLKKSAVTRIVQALERRGLLQRMRSNIDRRANRLNLTPAGQTVIEQVRRATQDQHRRWLAPIPAEKQAVFFEVLADLVEHLAETPLPPTEDDD
jgi:DNA-binding MarR family transcriptional regulator